VGGHRHGGDVSDPYQEALGRTLIERSFRERIVLVGVTLAGHTDDETEEGLDELSLLIDTAGADEAARLTQRRDTPDPAWYIGKGKVDELREVCLAVDADTVVFDNDLTPGQQYNLEKALGRTALDRTAVILDIFGQNAHSLEGKAQVELALLKYRLPRLRRGQKGGMSQQAGGIGTRTRGSGETKMELDRRRIAGRISRLEKDLRALQKTRQTQRKGRTRSGLASVVIVGYTNAGKSTLLNALTRAGVLAEDRLFATLDPTTRRLALPGGEPVLLTDTVGFIRQLPHALVESFKSTLEVAAEADLLVHVVDGSAVHPDHQIEAVRGVLAEIGADGVPEFIVFNKADLLEDGGAELVALHEGAVALSARQGTGLEDFLRRLADRMRAISRVTELLVPFERGDIIAAVHREGEVLSMADEDGGLRIRARLSGASEGRLRGFVVTGTGGEQSVSDD
jgi:GTP-binding protein HflX